MRPRRVRRYGPDDGRWCAARSSDIVCIAHSCPAPTPGPPATAHSPDIRAAGAAWWADPPTSSAPQQHRRQAVGELADGGADRRDLPGNTRGGRRHDKAKAAQRRLLTALEADAPLGLQDEVPGRILVEPLHVELDRRIRRNGPRGPLAQVVTLRQAHTPFLDHSH